ncbi:hypothetical protein HPB47_011059 [Ixodes persulcatus]|uniref:Uncharacterized protein n=1 Tax=Ixodes persulcatus TaxID=34615 RepID=A0AC60NXB3_IXOPE|nr:hypothetical protein HPB47_011059 [Ixodes persulcatus]
MSAKRKRLSLDEKRDILRRLDSGQHQVDVAKAFGIPASSLSTIKSQRQAIAAASESAQLGPARKRLCTGYFSKVDDAVATWLKDLRARNIPVSGNMIQEKAVEFAALFDVTGFDASSGWLHRFRARYGIVWKQVCGEASSADTAAASTAANWTTVDANLEEEEQDTDEESSEPDGWKELSERLGADSPLPFEDYAASESQIETCATLTTEEIVASALPQEEEEEEGESTLEEEAAKNSAEEALMCLEKLKAFAAQQTAVPEKIHESLDTVTQFTTSAQTVRLCVRLRTPNPAGFQLFRGEPEKGSKSEPEEPSRQSPLRYPRSSQHARPLRKYHFHRATSPRTHPFKQRREFLNEQSRTYRYVGNQVGRSRADVQVRQATDGALQGRWLRRTADLGQQWNKATVLQESKTT